MSILAVLALVFGAAAPLASAFTIGIAPAEEAGSVLPDLVASNPLGSLVSGCMDGLFNGGHIVTDALPLLVTHEEWVKPNFGFAQAKEGGMDYLIAVFAAWKRSSFRKGILLPSRIEYRFYNVEDGKLLAAGSIDGPPDGAAVADQPDRSAAKMGGLVATAFMERVGKGFIGGNR
jgi:hypothetical protein